MFTGAGGTIHGEFPLRPLTKRGLTHGRALKKSHASASRDTNQPL